MNQTTQEEPQIISPETEAKPYTPPAKKSHVPAGMEKLVFLGATMLVALVAVVVVFSHKMDPKAKQSTRQSKAAAAAGGPKKKIPAIQERLCEPGVCFLSLVVHKR